MCVWFWSQPAAKNILRNWTEEEKLQLAEAIDMFGTSDPRRLASRIPTKSTYQVVQMLRQLRINNRREIESVDMRELRFVVLNDMDDLFLAGGTKPLEVMDKWMDYLESFYGNERQFDKFKLFSKAFLIISECMPASKSCVDNIDFRWLVWIVKFIEKVLV